MAGAKSGTNTGTKRGESAEKPARKPRADGPAAGWSDAERAAFVREVLLAGPHGPELRAALAEHAKWMDVLGGALTARLAALARLEGKPAGELAWQLLEEAVSAGEDRHRRRAATDRARSRCQHPDKDRRGNRCGACGTRGLPSL